MCAASQLDASTLEDLNAMFLRLDADRAPAKRSRRRWGGVCACGFLVLVLFRAQATAASQSSSSEKG